MQNDEKHINVTINYKGYDYLTDTFIHLQYTEKSVIHGKTPIHVNHLRMSRSSLCSLSKLCFL